MAETPTVGHSGLSSRSTPVSPRAASGAAVDALGDCAVVEDAERRSSASSHRGSRDVGYKVGRRIRAAKLEGPKPCYAKILPSELGDINGAIFRMRDNKRRRAENAGDAQVSASSFANTMEKLRNAFPIIYGVSRQVPTIYKVPVELKRHSYGDEVKEYRPVAVCIGGFADHYQRRMFELEDYKWCCVRQLISRHSGLMEPAKTHVLLLGCLESMKRLLPRIWGSYSQDIVTDDDDELAQMMLLDGCFILHRLLKYARRAEREAAGGGAAGDQDEDEDWTQVYGRCWVWQSATRDLLLLKYQIPFFVVQELFQKLRNDDETEELLVTGGRRLFRSLRPQMLHRSPIACNDVHHLLHLFYLSVGFPPTDRTHPRRQPDVFLPELPQWVPCAKELEEAGIRFRKRKNDATSFLDIKFDSRRGVLEIPPLELDDSSRALFRNLIAFEQAYPDTLCDISAYAIFMDCLINTPQDMRILHLHGILVNQMSGEPYPGNFFNRICAQVHCRADNYLVDLMDELNKYKECRRHKWRAALVRKYFNTPWMAISLLAAVLLLTMTMLQTFFTVYPYFKPPSK